MRLLGLAGGTQASSVPSQRAVSPGSSWDVEVWLDPLTGEARAHVIALALGRRAVHRLTSWLDLERVVRAHGLRSDDVVWHRETYYWCLEHWGVPADQ